MASKTFILFAVVAVAVALLSVATARQCEGGRLDILEAQMDVCLKHIAPSRDYLPSMCSRQVIAKMEQKGTRCRVQNAVSLLYKCLYYHDGAEQAKTCLQKSIDNGICC
ncbi:uncharacterized protein LOC113204925 isoform X2 [Frankliniella occidentalis]|uniref:Uncharacterized protein LOC113204925 isoform X1 n=1 Tax=Frankliniella occidentalis TaxID=133901 RepID=A0A6J1S4Z8_FRAOC|nr:uncharacterized protein LOC113204925 isoform X1 [Frankliniella occidentalis]XP_052119832.1 uncharacterized protein LOC113204925 isoform X2 [Frankliniella occidentalis]